MSNDNSNDNAALPVDTTKPGASGYAAILLVESLIHVLIEQSIISLATGVEIVECAAEVSRNSLADAGDLAPTVERSTVLLESISRSLSHDLHLSGLRSKDLRKH